MQTDRTAFFLAGALSGAALAVGTYSVYRGYGSWWRSRLASPELRTTKDNANNGHAKLSMADALNDEILSEQFTRNVQFFGRSGQEAILKAFVVVVGLGGVGSHAAHMLLRAGVGRLRIVDFDQVSLSSLNRHAVATQSDVGLPKAVVLKEHFSRIVPEAEVEALVSMYTEESEQTILAGDPAYVIDAIDDISTKIALLAACKRRKIPVLCACGAGAKADPSRVRVADLSEASCDPLARKVRYMLRQKHEIMNGIPMVLSTEKPRCNLIPVEQLSHDPHELQIIPNFRIRTVPVLGTTPAIFGLTAASWVLCHLAGSPYIPEPLFRIKGSEYEPLLHRLEDREEIVFGNSHGVDLDLEELIWLAKNVWRAKSARANLANASGEKGLSRFLGDLQFTRWDAQQPPLPNNLILLSNAEAEEHDKTSLDTLRLTDPSFVADIETILRLVSSAFGMS